MTALADAFMCLCFHVYEETRQVLCFIGARRGLALSADMWRTVIWSLRDVAQGKYRKAFKSGKCVGGELDASKDGALTTGVLRSLKL